MISVSYDWVFAGYFALANSLTPVITRVTFRIMSILFEFLI
jgi:hypothetical protein